jgi:hypothetical protein
MTALHMAAYCGQTGMPTALSRERSTGKRDYTTYDDRRSLQTPFGNCCPTYRRP